MIPCLSEVTTLPSSFAEDVAAYADGGCRAMEVWLTKLEKHLEKSSIAEVHKLLGDRGMAVPVASYQGGLLLSHGAARTAAFDHFKKRLDVCQALGIRTIVLVADFATPIDERSLGTAVSSLNQAAIWAAGFGVTLALEFRGSDTFCTSLDTALALVAQANEPNLGVCLDLFHFYKGPSKPEDYAGLTAANLAHVQLCDVPGVPRELMTDADRVLPGEGDFHLEPLAATLKRIGYAGTVSVELMNPVLWKSKPTQIAELAMASLERFASKVC